MAISHGTVPSLDGTKTLTYTVKTNSWFARFVAWLRRDPNMGGITVWSTIRFVDDASAVPQLIKHESRHVAQWHAYGPIGFTVRYFRENMKHGYANNAFEIDAMKYAGQI